MKQPKIYENNRISGAVINTILSTLPERFVYGPHTRQMSEYLSRRWSAHSYGWYRRSSNWIEYNREWIPDSQKRSISPNKYRWVEHPSNGLRFVGKVHEIRMSGDGNLPYFDRSLVDHTGWYTNAYQNETVCGEVYQLPARNGVNQYVPAVSDPDNDGAVIDFHSATEDIHDAIRWADSMAEHYANDAKEADIKDRAEQRIEEIDSEIKSAYQDLIALVRELKGNCQKLTDMPLVRQTIRNNVARVREEISELRAEKRKIEDEPWTASPSW